MGLKQLKVTCAQSLVRQFKNGATVIPGAIYPVGFRQEFQTRLHYTVVFGTARLYFSTRTHILENGTLEGPRVNYAGRER